MFTSGVQPRCIIGYDTGEGQGPRTVGLMLKGFLVRNVLVELYGYEVNIYEAGPAGQFLVYALHSNSIDITWQRDNTKEITFTLSTFHLL